MSIDTSRRDMNKNIKWQSTLVNMCTSYQSLAMMILYDSRMTNVFLLKNFSFQEQLFHSQTQCLYIVLHFAGAKMISGLSSSTLFFLMFGTYSMPSGVVFYLCLLSGRQSLGYGAVGSFEVTLYSISNNCPTPCTDTINNNVNNSIVSIVIFIRAGLIWRPGQIFTEHRQLIKFLSMRFGIYSFIFNQGLIHWFIFRSFR